MNWLINKLDQFDDSVVIIQDDISYTYKQLFNNIKYIKENIIKHKIKPGEVVSTLATTPF